MWSFAWKVLFMGSCRVAHIRLWVPPSFQMSTSFSNAYYCKNFRLNTILVQCKFMVDITRLAFDLKVEKEHQQNNWTEKKRNFDCLIVSVILIVSITHNFCYCFFSFIWLFFCKLFYC